jgi:hypothetical protein
MTQSFWQRGLQLFTGRSHPRRGRPSRCRLNLELFEERTLLSTLTVTNLQDSGDGSLRGQIAAAASGDTIVFDNSLSGTIALTSGELALFGNLTIQGPGAGNLMVSGNNAQRVFHVEPGANATISGLTIANGRVVNDPFANHGGGIECEGSLTLRDSTLTGNNNSFGGGLSFDVLNTGPASLTVSGCAFTNNTAGLGAGIFSGVTNRSGLVTVTFTNTNFRGNAGGFGGGLDSDATLSGTASLNLTVSGGTFSGNSATRGGAISSSLHTADISQGTVTLTDQGLVQNNSAQNGGGVYSEVISSGSSQATFSLGTFFSLLSNAASQLGGGLDSLVTSNDDSRASLTWLGSSAAQVTNNTARDGAGIASQVTTNGSGSATATFTNCNNSFNIASEFGGGLYSLANNSGSGTASVTLGGGGFFFNEASSQGGGLYSSVTVTGSGSASVNDIAGVSYRGNTAGLSGGGVYAAVTNMGSGSAATSLGGGLSGNTAGNGGGGGIFLTVSAQDTGAATATLSGGASANTTTGSGGGISATVASSGLGAASVTLTRTTATGNTAGSFGGGLFARLTGGGAGPVALTVNTSTLSGNNASQGGGLYAMVNSSGPSPRAAAGVTLNGSTVSGNRAGSGAGLFFDLASGGLGGTVQAAVNTSTIEGNSTPGDGGGLLVREQDTAATATTLAVTNSTLYANQGANGGGLLSSSAGLVNAASGVTLLSDTVAFNNATSSGGGLDAVGGPFTVRSTIVAANTANAGADAAGGFGSAGHNLIGQTTGSSGWASTDLTGTAASPLDPRFGDLTPSFPDSTRTLALLGNSPAARAGDPAGPPTDQLGVPRSRTVPSIGAFEVLLPTSFQVVPALTSVRVGNSLSFTVTVLDNRGQAFPGFTGTVHFGSSDPNATLPADYTFTTAEGGRHIFTPGVTFQAEGVQTITVTGAGITQTASVTAFLHPDSFQVVTNMSVRVGVPVPVTVRVLGRDGLVLTAYDGTVHFSSSDPDAVLPADFTFTAVDRGQHTFAPGVTFQAAGAQTVSVTGEGVTGMATLTVSPGPISLLNPDSWTALGPAPLFVGQTPGNQPVSGRISAVAADPTNANIVYLAAAGGGVWKTTDGGAHWTPLTDDQGTLFMGALALTPSDPNTIYAGTGEATNSVLSFTGHGVLKSTDGGATWALLGQDVFNRHTIAQIVVSPVDPDTVYVAVAGAGVNGVSGNGGVWKSTDGGLTWTDTTTAISTTEAFSDVEMDPTDPQTLYAAVGSFRGSAVNGVYKTTDGGATWAVAGSFPTGLTEGRITIAIAPADPQMVYALVSASGQGGTTLGRLTAVMKSTDGGTTWAALPNPPDLGSNGWYGLPLAVDPSNVNTVYAAEGGDRIVESVDGGLTWFSIAVGADFGGPHSDHHAFAFDANGKLLDGNDGGIWCLDNPARTNLHWTDLNTNLQLTQFIGIALDPSTPGVAYGGSQDNGTSKFANALGWTILRGGDGGFVRVDPNNPSTVYHEFTGVSLERSDDGGNSFFSKTFGISPNDPSSFYVPFVMDPSDPTRLLLGTNRVYETTNRGDFWRPISTPGSGGWTVSSVIDSLATAAADGNTIYASAGGHIFVTFDDGSSWQQRDVPGVTDHFQDLQVDPTDPLTAYAVRDRFGGGHVFKTTDGGLSWTDISGDLPDLPTYTLALDPRSNTLYVGTDDGVYVSVNQGNTWSRFGVGLPHAQVRDLELNTNLQILAAGTHGRGLWEILLPSPEGSGGARSPLASEPAPLPSRPPRIDLGVPGPKSSETLSSLNFSVPLVGSSLRPSIAGITDNGSGTFTLMGTQLNSVGVATGDTPVSVNLTLPAGIPDGTYSLSEVADDIASDLVEFAVDSGGAVTGPDPLEGPIGF